MPRTINKRTEESKRSIAPIAGQVKWVNNGGAFYTKQGKRIPHGESFYAMPDDIPSAFRDVIKPVDPAVLKAAEQPLRTAKPDFHLRRRKGTDFFDVLDGNGKRISEKDLTEEEAKQLLEMLV